MRIYLWCFALLLCTSGCSIHPLPEDVTGDTTVDIVKKIRCEARQAIEEYDPYRKLDKAVIGYNFHFIITEDNNAGASTVFQFPFTTGKFTLGLGASKDRQRIGERDFTILDFFEETRKEDCSVQATSANWKYPITGIVGLDETIGTFVKLNGLSLLEQGNEKTASFTDTLEFTTTIKANANPKIELNPVSGRFRLTEAQVALSAGRIDKHKLIISLQIPKPRGALGGDAKTRAFFSIQEQKNQQLLRPLDTLRILPR